MRGRPTDSGPQARKVKEAPQSIFRRWMQLSLTGRMFLLVVIAVLPALVIQAVNEYALRTAREDEIRQRVIQITKQFGEEIQAIRAGASQLLVALGELDEVQKRDTKECGATFAKLKAIFGPNKLVDLVLLMGNYAGAAALLAAVDMQLHEGKKPLLPIP